MCYILAASVPVAIGAVPVPGTRALPAEVVAIEAPIAKPYSLRSATQKPESKQNWSIFGTVNVSIYLDPSLSGSGVVLAKAWHITKAIRAKTRMVLQDI